MTGPGSPPLAWTELERLVAAGDVDTVIVAFTDMQGRLAGKRISGRHFVDDIATRGVECCSYLLAVDVDLNTVPGYAMASWDTGYGDMVMTPDLSTLRLIPWLPGTALVIADLVWADGSEVAVSPRSILRRQLDRLKARGLVADVATELEFIVFDQPYRQAWASGYRGLTPASDYNIDYAIVFTGSTEVGKRVMAGAAAQVKRVTLELGGKSANIVFHDCDLERAATTAPAGVFDNAGQDCCARSRILVQRSVYDRFMELLEPAVHSIVVGDPGSRATEMGPLVSRAHRDKVAGYVPDDAPVAFRGTAPAGRGFWFPPTVLTPKRGDRTVTDEIFGPVVVVLTFDDEADAISLANDTAYGLSGSIWTDDLSRALRVARAVESGNLSVNSHSSVRFNTPFGGFKQSGVGRELGPDAPLQFTETKNVFIAVGEEM